MDILKFISPVCCQWTFGSCVVLDCLNNAAVINLVHTFLCTNIHISIDYIYPGVILLSYWVYVFSPLVKLLCCVQLFVIPWTVACQAPPSVEFSRQEY